MSLPEIEDYIGHKIDVASYDPALLPEPEKPKPKSRRRPGPQRKRSRKKHGSKRRPRRKSE